MPDLSFEVAQASPLPYAVTPTLALRLRVMNDDPEQVIHTVALRCQVQIEATRRRYTAADQARLRDLFGEPERWGQTLRSMLWTHSSAVLPQFSGSGTVDLHLPCSFDFNVAATKYFHGLSDGEVPLCLQFSGTVFYADASAAMQVAPISWGKETRFRLPLTIWKEMMDLYYPNSAWLSLRRDAFEALLEYKVRNGIPTWEQTIERILASVGATETARS
jgi:hypothetical protein